MHGFVADDQADHVGGVGELGATGPVHGKIEAGIEQEGLEEDRGHLLLERIAAVIFPHDQCEFPLQEFVFLRPTVCVIDIRRRA